MPTQAKIKNAHPLYTQLLMFFYNDLVEQAHRFLFLLAVLFKCSDEGNDALFLNGSKFNC